MIKIINPEAPAVKTVSEMGKNKVALVTLGKGHKLSEVMKKKSTLREKKPYSRVFIEPQKTIAEQRTEANIRALAKATRGVGYQRGRVTDAAKDQTNVQGNQRPKPDTTDNNQATETQQQKDRE